jgi:hypothetical protein
MAYCIDPRNHRKAWWADAGSFTYFDWRRNKIIPSRTGWVHCEICHHHWGTTNRELVAKLPTRRPQCHEYGQPHNWKYHSEALRECLQCLKTETKDTP